MAFRTRFQLNLDPYIFNNIDEFYHHVSERGIDLEHFLELGNNEKITLDNSINMIDGNKIECTLLWDDEYSFLEIISSTTFKNFKTIIDDSGWQLILQERDKI